MSNESIEDAQGPVRLVLDALCSLSTHCAGEKDSVFRSLTKEEAHASKIASASDNLGQELWRQGDCTALSFVSIKR